MVASYTPNYNLKKPASADFFSVEDANGNMDLVDLALKGNADGVNANATNISNLAGGGRTTETVKGNADNINNHKANNKIHPITGTAGGTAAALTLTTTAGNIVPADGDKVQLKLPVAIGDGATLSIDGGTAHPIKASSGDAVSSGAVADSYLSMIYNGLAFILQGEGGGINITGQGKSVVNYYENITKGNLVTIRRHFGFDTLVKLANPSTLPSNQIQDIAFSPDDTFLAIGVNSSPGVLIYKRNGDVFTKLANPSTVFASVVYGVSFSPDGKYLVVTGSPNSLSSNPQLILYKISGDTFTPVQVWTGSSAILYDVKFSPDSKYIAYYSTGTSLQLKVYSVGSDDTLTYVASATGAGTNVIGGKLSWSHDSSYIAIAYQSASNIKVFAFNGATLTAQTIPSLSTGTGSACACAFHPSDNTLLAVCDVSANIKLLRRSGTTFTLETTLSISGYGKSCYWSSDGVYISAVSYTSPYIETYKNVSGSYTKMANPSVLPPNACNDVVFGNLNSYVAVGSIDTPYIVVYKADILGDYAYIYDSLSDLYVGNYINFGYAKTTGSANDSNKEIITLPFKI